MSKAGNMLRRTGWMLFSLIALAVLMIVLSRVTTPNAELREAVELMQRDDLPDGRDTFGLLWTLDRDVPFDEIDAVAQADVAKVAEWPQDSEPGKIPGELTRWQRDEYPDLSLSGEDREPFCRTDSPVRHRRSEHRSPVHQRRRRRQPSGCPVPGRQRLP